MPSDIVVVTPFRRHTFRTAAAPAYCGTEEPWDSPAFIIAGAARLAGLDVAVLPLQNLFPGYDEDDDTELLHSILAAHPARVALFAADNYVASRSTGASYGIRIISSMIREIHPGTVIAMCGRLATVLGSDAFGLVANLDAVLLGEIEAVAPRLMRKLLTAARPADEHILWRAIADQTTKPSFLIQLDSAPLPAFDTVPEDVYEIFRERRHRSSGRIPFSLRTSAGCKYRCRFCAGVPYWLDYRTKSADRVAAEIDTLERQLGGRARLCFFEDEIFTRHVSHVRETMKVLRERNICLEGVYTHSSLVTDEVLGEISRSVRRVFLGLDTVSDTMQKLFRKGQTMSTLLDAVECAHRAGVGVHFEIIVGAPGETADTSAAMLWFAHNAIRTGLIEDANTYVFCAHPGTEFATSADRYGLSVDDDFEWMQESGGFPAHHTASLSRSQIFAIYLMSQTLIQEAREQRRSLSAAQANEPAPGQLRALAQIIEKIG